MGIFSRKKTSCNHAADVTVEGMVNHYLSVGVINAQQLAALTGMARSSADKAELERLNEAIETGTMQFDFMQDRR